MSDILCLQPDEAATMGEAARVRLASDPLAPAGMLELFAADKAVTVRAALALNPAVPEVTIGTIARDPDDRVRALLARRLAGLLPSLSTQHRAHLLERATTTLMLLAADQAVRVRAALADVVKELADVPHALILQLSRDEAVCVSEPVIRLSPLLTADDLMALVSAPPHGATVTSVARRPSLTAQVSDVIVAGADDVAIMALLTNQSAAISERALDTLIAQAADHTEWQLPLVRRRTLSVAGLRHLAAIVTDHVLAAMAERGDLSFALSQEIATRLGPALLACESVRRPTYGAPSLDEAVLQAHAMAADGTLTEQAVLAAARRGEARVCSAMLAVAARVPAAVVDRAITLRSAKGLLSLLWRAGFSMRAAGPLQTLLVRLPPESALQPTDTNGFPLSDEEMRWQIDFLTRIGRTDRAGEA